MLRCERRGPAKAARAAAVIPDGAAIVPRVEGMRTMRRMLALVLPGMLALAGPAAAANLVTNGDFESADVTTKTTFAGNVTGWSGGDLLTFIDTPGAADNGTYLSVYGPFPNHSPAGGNFVEADGDPIYSSAFSQTISGLTVGRQYHLSFYQAAGQQSSGHGGTTERWSVSFGDDTQLSSRYHLPNAGVGPWQQQFMTFTATGTSEVLSFLATGTPHGAPPISFLDGVSLVGGAPEPAEWALLLAGFGLVGATLRRRGEAVAVG
jgi:hypothetical protein